MNRQQVLKAQIADYEHRQYKANAPETLQEDKAFMNRMKTVRFHNFSEGELKRLWRIGLRGIEARDGKWLMFEKRYVKIKRIREGAEIKMARLPKKFYELIKIVDGDDMFGIDVNHPDLVKARTLIGDKPLIVKGVRTPMHKVFIYKGTELVHQCEGYDAAGLFLKMSSTTVRNRADDGNPTRSGYTVKVEKK